MDHSPIKDVDGSDFPYARETAHSGRAVEVMSPQDRPHPYSRRPSLPMLDSGPRIQLPSLEYEGSAKPDAPRSNSQSYPINIPGISSLDMRDGPWHRSADRDRYWNDRSRLGDRTNDERIVMTRTASTGSSHPQPFRLPSFHALSNSEPHKSEPLGPGSTVMPPPPPRPRTNPPSPRFAYARPTSPLHQVSHSLRPSYSSHARSGDRHDMQEYPPVKREGSPPLRSIHTYDSPSIYPQSPAGYYQGDGRAQVYHGHPQQHPAHFVNRGPHHPSYADPSRRRQEEERPAGPGQSRRLAHLMSEQKRRESINTGFVGLRQVVPSAAATDSKAVILRKAAAHIKHLEAILANRQTGGRVGRTEEKDNRYREVSDPSSLRNDAEIQYREVSDERDESTASSTSESRDIKMEREGSEDNEWRPSTRN